MKPIQDYVEEPEDVVIVFRKSEVHGMRVEVFGAEKEALADADLSIRFAKTIMAAIGSCSHFYTDLQAYVVMHIQRKEAETKEENPLLSLVVNNETEH